MKQRARTMYGNWLSTSETASILGISTRTLFRLLASGAIERPARDEQSGYFLWRPEEVEGIHQERLRKKS